MKITRLEIPEVCLVEPRVFGDRRGWFMETWRADLYRERVTPLPFVQDNLARSQKNVLRGLHAQHPHDQGKLVQVFLGEVYDVAVDIRRGSPTFGRYVSARLSGDNKRQLWVPPGFAHGYCVLSDEAVFGYKCTDTYHPENQFGIRWDDPEIHIDWPLDEAPILSDKDADAPLLAAIAPGRLPGFRSIV